MKRCFKCLVVKPLSEFYRHKNMRDGHLNKCIDCALADVKKYRLGNLDRIRAYDRKRGARQTHESTKAYRAKYPERYRANNMLNNHLRAGNMSRKPCEVCGSEEKIHGHHDDYSKPLDVRWLCPVHHKAVHADG